MKPVKVGAEFSDVVCTVAVLLELFPTCDEPLKVFNSKVPLKLLMFAIAESTVERCEEVSVIVFEPLESDNPESVSTVEEPFLITSVCV